MQSLTHHSHDAVTSLQPNWGAELNSGWRENFLDWINCVRNGGRSRNLGEWHNSNRLSIPASVLFWNSKKKIWGITFAIPSGMRKMRNQIFNSPGNEEAKLAGYGNPWGPHWELYPFPYPWKLGDVCAPKWLPSSAVPVYWINWEAVEVKATYVLQVTTCYYIPSFFENDDWWDSALNLALVAYRVF